MQFELEKGSLAKRSGDVAVLCIFASDTGTQKNDGLIAEALRRTYGRDTVLRLSDDGFSGEAGQTRLISTGSVLPCRYLLLVGLGKRREWSIDLLRDTAAQIAKEVDAVQAGVVAIELWKETIAGLSSTTRLRTVVEGMMLGAYRFDRYRQKKKKPFSVKKVVVISSRVDAALKQALQAGEAAGRATCFARDLANTPGNDLTPTALASIAQDVAKRAHLGCTVLGPTEIKKEKMGGLLAVAQGSEEPPRFIHLRYRPKGRIRKKIALVGKGVTFDSGGISIKTPKGMEKMKYDMTGAAVVIATIEVAAQLKLAVAIDAYIPTSENLPDGKAFKPGDIIKARNGKTIEIISTDAEGRLLLADALSYAGEQKPDAIIDVATLTGGATIAVGYLYVAMLGNDAKLNAKIKKAAATVGEGVWELPLDLRYLKQLTSGPADVSNGGAQPSTILGGAFLSQFVPDGIPWVHLDIAARAWADEETFLSVKGATAPMIPTLVSFLASL